MKRFIFVLMAIAIIAFTGCSKDDNKGGGGNASIIGTWSYVEGNSPEPSRTFIFYEGGTGKEDSYNMVWSLTGNALTISTDTPYIDIPITFTVLELTNTRLKIQWLSFVLTYKRVS